MRQYTVDERKAQEEFLARVRKAQQKPRREYCEEVRKWKRAVKLATARNENSY